MVASSNIETGYAAAGRRRTERKREQVRRVVRDLVRQGVEPTRQRVREAAQTTDAFLSRMNRDTGETPRSIAENYRNSLARRLAEPPDSLEAIAEWGSQDFETGAFGMVQDLLLSDRPYPEDQQRGIAQLFYGYLKILLSQADPALAREREHALASAFGKGVAPSWSAFANQIAYLESATQETGLNGYVWGVVQQLQGLSSVGGDYDPLKRWSWVPGRQDDDDESPTLGHAIGAAAAGSTKYLKAPTVRQQLLLSRERVQLVERLVAAEWAGDTTPPVPGPDGRPNTRLLRVAREQLGVHLPSWQESLTEPVRLELIWRAWFDQAWDYVLFLGSGMFVPRPGEPDVREVPQSSSWLPAAALMMDAARHTRAVEIAKLLHDWIESQRTTFAWSLLHVGLRDKLSDPPPRPGPGRRTTRPLDDTFSALARIQAAVSLGYEIPVPVLFAIRELAEALPGRYDMWSADARMTLTWDEPQSTDDPS